MASTPNYEGEKRQGAAILNSGSGTSLSAAALTGVAAGTRVKEIRIHSAGGASPGSNKKVAVVLDDGTNQCVIDVVLLADVLNQRQAVLRYDNVFLVGTGCSIKFQMTSSLASSSALHCEVFGADF